MKNIYYIGKDELTFDDLERIINENIKLELSQEAKERIQKCRDYLDRKMQNLEQRFAYVAGESGEITRVQCWGRS